MNLYAIYQTLLNLVESEQVGITKTSFDLDGQYGTNISIVAEDGRGNEYHFEVRKTENKEENHGKAV